MAEFIPNPLGIAEIIRSPRGPVYRTVFARTLKVEALAKRLCPVDTGRLRASIRHTVVAQTAGVTGFVGTDVKYAPFVHNGTKAHTVTPRNKKALFWPGADHPVVRVKIPARTARPFLRDALVAAY